MTKKLNITDVAKTAGVSTTTVSRVINRVSTVSEENRRRVEEAIRRLRYHPNVAAQRLAAGKTDAIGVIMPRFEGMFHSFYGMEVLKGIGGAAERLRCDLVLHITDGTTFVNPAAVGGVIFADIDGSAELLDQALEAGLPCVVLNHYIEELPVSCVAVDNKAAVKKVVQYLVKLGHRDIATVTGDLKTQAGLDRFDGFISAMKDAGCAVKNDHIIHGGWSVDKAREGAARLLALPDRPTAVFAASDDMAIEVMHAALDKGLRVPEDLSVVGFDDNPIAAHARVPLTTIRQPLDEMGKTGAEVLWQLMQGKRKAPLKLMLPTTLIERQSCRQTWLER